MRVSDFGLSHVHEEGPVKRGVVYFRCVPRWQEFLSPEAVQGQIDPLIDYWALGVTMFQVITGKVCTLFVRKIELLTFLLVPLPY